MQVNWQVLNVPPVLLDLAEFDALYWVGLKHAPNEVFTVGRDLDRHAVVALLDFHEEHGQLLVVEWQAAADHGVENDAATPNVHLLPAVLLPRDHFRRCVVR